MAHSDVSGLLKRHGYTQIKKIGEGSFGKALLVESKDGQKMICKMVDVSKASKKEQEEAVKEGKVLSELNHAYIVRYRENFQESGWLCIVMDYCEGGDLTARIKEAKKAKQSLDEVQILKWFTQAIMALKYIHDKHILHRDLKPSNFFLSKNGSMRMGDFGIAKVLACTIAVAQTQIGTPYYLSPELCQEKPYAWPSDIWAMGCILYELCALKVPFDAANIPGLVQKICRGAVPQVPDSYSPFVRQLCSKMLNRDPKLRPSTDDILDMPEIKEIMQEMLEECREKASEKAAVAPAPAPAEAPGGGAPADKAGKYSEGDLVEYNSTAHKEWLPATVIKVDGEGKVVIDLKPNTWITVAEQVLKIRLRVEGAPAADPSAAAPEQAGIPPSRSAMHPSSVRSSTPSRAASPRVNSRPPSRGASPSAGVLPSAGGAAGSRPGSRGGYGGGGGGGGLGSRPASRGASPMSRGAPVVQRSPSGSSLAAAYRRGDLVEYHSSSHKEWLPAVVNNVNEAGDIIIDLKPNTWISKQEQATKIRHRRSAGTPAGRAPSPRRDLGMARPGSGGSAARPGSGVPRVPQSPLRQESPLRRGGAAIIGS